MSLLQRATLPAKFLLLSLIAVVLTAIPSYFYFAEANRALGALQFEQEGIEPVRTMLRTIQYTQQHRGLSSLYLNGADSVNGRAAKQEEADKSYALLDTVVAATADADLNERWARAKADWSSLRDNVSARRIDVQASIAGHTALIGQLLKLNELVADHYGLSLDPNKDTYQLIQAVYYQQPYMTEELGRLRASGTALLAKHEATPEERLTISGQISRARDRIDQLQTAFGKSTRVNPAFEQELGGAMRQATTLGAALLTTAAEQIVKPEQLSMAAPSYLAQATAAINAQFAANHQAGKLLDGALQSRIDR